MYDHEYYNPFFGGDGIFGSFFKNACLTKTFARKDDNSYTVHIQREKYYKVKSNSLSNDNDVSKHFTNFVMRTAFYHRDLDQPTSDRLLNDVITTSLKTSALKSMLSGYNNINFVGTFWETFKVGNDMNVFAFKNGSMNEIVYDGFKNINILAVPFVGIAIMYPDVFNQIVEDPLIYNNLPGDFVFAVGENGNTLPDNLDNTALVVNYIYSSIRVILNVVVDNILKDSDIMKAIKNSFPNYDTVVIQFRIVVGGVYDDFDVTVADLSVRHSGLRQAIVDTIMQHIARNDISRMIAIFKSIVSSLNSGDFFIDAAEARKQHDAESASWTASYGGLSAADTYNSIIFPRRCAKIAQKYGATTERLAEPLADIIVDRFKNLLGIKRNTTRVGVVSYAGYEIFRNIYAKWAELPEDIREFYATFFDLIDSNPTPDLYSVDEIAKGSVIVPQHLYSKYTTPRLSLRINMKKKVSSYTADKKPILSHEVLFATVLPLADPKHSIWITTKPGSDAIRIKGGDISPTFFTDLYTVIYSTPVSSKRTEFRVNSSLVISLEYKSYNDLPTITTLSDLPGYSPYFGQAIFSADNDEDEDVDDEKKRKKTLEFMKIMETGSEIVYRVNSQGLLTTIGEDGKEYVYGADSLKAISPENKCYTTGVKNEDCASLMMCFSAGPEGLNDLTKCMGMLRNKNMFAIAQKDVLRTDPRIIVKFLKYFGFVPTKSTAPDGKTFYKIPSYDVWMRDIFSKADERVKDALLNNDYLLKYLQQIVNIARVNDIILDPRFSSTKGLKLKQDTNGINDGNIRYPPSKFGVKTGNAHDFLATHSPSELFMMNYLKKPRNMRLIVDTGRIRSGSFPYVPHTTEITVGSREQYGGTINDEYSRLRTRPAQELHEVLMKYVRRLKNNHEIEVADDVLENLHNVISEVDKYTYSFGDIANRLGRFIEFLEIYGVRGGPEVTIEALQGSDRTMLAYLKDKYGDFMYKLNGYKHGHDTAMHKYNSMLSVIARPPSGISHIDMSVMRAHA